MGACPGQTASIFTSPGVVFDYMLHGCPVPSSVAPPGAPGGSGLTLPPASEADAQASVDALTNQQLSDQQALNAAGVQSSWWDSLTGGAYSAGSAVGSTFSWLPWILGGVAVAAVFAVGGGSPRRYGR